MDKFPSRHAWKQIIKIVVPLPGGLRRTFQSDLNTLGLLRKQEAVCLAPALHDVLVWTVPLKVRFNSPNHLGVVNVKGPSVFSLYFI